MPRVLHVRKRELAAAEVQTHSRQGDDEAHTRGTLLTGAIRGSVEHVGSVANQGTIHECKTLLLRGMTRILAGYREQT